MLSMDLGDAAAVVSAFAALVSLAVCIYVEIRTRKLIEPTERPVISLSGHPEVEARVIDQPPRLNMLVMFIFKNLGKHPAHNVRFRVGLVENGRWAEFCIVHDSKFANAVDPGQEFKLTLDKSSTGRRTFLNPCIFNKAA